MASTFTANKSLQEPANGDLVNQWDTAVNPNMTVIDTALGGSALLNSTGLSGNTNLSLPQYQPLELLVSGTPTGTITYVVPSGVGGFWIFANGTSGGQTVGIKSNAGGATITVPAGQATIVACDGSASGMRLGISTSVSAAGSNTQVQFNSGGLLGASAGLTWDGTTLATTGLNNVGNTVLGDAAGDTLTISGTAISAPNNININAGQFFLAQATGFVGIGTAAPSTLLTVAGTIFTTAGGVKFPDSTTQTTATSTANTWYLIQSGNVSAQPFIDIAIPAGTNNVQLVIDIAPSLNDAQVFVQYGDANTNPYGTARYDWWVTLNGFGSTVLAQAGGAGSIILCSGIIVPAVAVLSGIMFINNVKDAPLVQATWSMNYPGVVGMVPTSVVGDGWFLTSGQPLTHVRLTATGGATLTGRYTALGTV